MRLLTKNEYAVKIKILPSIFQIYLIFLLISIQNFPIMQYFLTKKYEFIGEFTIIFATAAKNG